MLTRRKEIRRIFASRINTETDGEGVITALPSNIRPGKNAKSRGGQRQRSDKPSFKKLGGDYLHLTLYKENRDTMEAVNTISRMIHIKPNLFGFAGTKDRRAATVQRMSIRFARHETLDYINAQVASLKMGDYKYSPFPIELGDHGGNAFKITVKSVVVSRGENYGLERRVQLTKQAVEAAVTSVHKYGFINYYGLQRFGTHLVGTHELGKRMLTGDYEGVIDGLLHVDPEFMSKVIAGAIQETLQSRDDINRVRAVVHFKTAKNPKAALQVLPKRFYAEANVIEHLQKNPRDFQGAISTISRSMRNLYLHAYQSYVWNHVASHRWAKYGSKVIPGDLVLVVPQGASLDGADEEEFQRARPLSEEEANSGKYTIFDIVLPGPGYDVVYPSNDIGEFYVEFMKKRENGGMDPYNMRRTKRDFSVPGNYRRLLGRLIGEPKWDVRTYVDDNEQMRPTDTDLIEMRKAEAKTKVEAEAVPAPVENKQEETVESTQASEQATTTTKQPRQDDNPEIEPRVNDVWAQTSEEGSSKRIKFKQDDSHPDTPDVDQRGQQGGGAPLWLDEEGPKKPTGLPSDSHDTVVLASTYDSRQKAFEMLPNKENSAPIHSFTQGDMSSYPEDQVKIAVVLEFDLVQSAYATVVLRELMAEAE